MSIKILDNLINQINNNDITVVDLSVDTYKYPNILKAFNKEVMFDNEHEEKLDELFKSLQNNTSVKYLDLTGNSLDKGIIQLVQSINLSNAPLHTLNLSNNSLNKKGILAIADLLHKNTSIKKLDLSSTRIGTIGKELVTFLHAVILNTSLNELNLSNNGLGQGTFELAIIQLMTKYTTLPQVSSLRRLNLSCNKIKSNTIEQLLKLFITSTSLQHLDLSKNNLKKRGFMLVADFLSINASLRSLDLSDILSMSMYGDIGLTALFDAIKNTKLKKLSFANNGLMNQDDNLIANLLANNSSLQCLNLSNCNFSVSAIINILDALINNTSLLNLNLSFNMIDNDISANVLTDVLTENSLLQVLDLSSCDIPYTGLEKIIGSLKINQSLKELILENNIVSSTAAGILADVISVNCSLQKINILSDTCISTGDYIKIIDSLESNFTITELKIYKQCQGNNSDINTINLAKILNRNKDNSRFARTKVALLID